MGLSKDKYINALLHLLIWSLLTFILFLYPKWSNKGVELPADFTIKQVVHLLLMLVAYYFNAYLLVPKLLFKNKYLLFALTISFFVLISSFILAAVEGWLRLPEQMQHVWGSKRASDPPLFDRFGFFTTLITLGISTSVSAINKLNSDNKEKLRLEKENVITELSILKAQIHPHFFFNTLNSIYALSFTDAEQSRKVLTKLSNIMRYLLYDTNQHLVPLSKEISFIKNYVEIMKLRLNSNAAVELSLPETISSNSIAPMILMPYVENVFKHGVDENDNNILSIRIRQTEKIIQLKTRNRIAKTPALITEETPAGGIGMQNTLRRLELLYKKRYKLITQISPANEFELELELELQ